MVVALSATSCANGGVAVARVGVQAVGRACFGHAKTQQGTCFGITRHATVAAQPECWVFQHRPSSNPPKTTTKWLTDPAGLPVGVENGLTMTITGEIALVAEAEIAIATTDEITTATAT